MFKYSDSDSKRSDEELEKSVNDVLAFETEVARIQVPEEQRRNNTRLYNPTRLSSLNSLLGNLMGDWREYFQWMVPVENEALERLLSNDPEVIVREPEYFKALNALVKATDKRVIANYMFWQYFTDWTLQIDERFDDVTQVLLSVVNSEFFQFS